MADSMNVGGVDLSSATYGVSVVEGPISVVEEPDLRTSKLPKLFEVAI